jgi:hypothetical protein
MYAHYEISSSELKKETIKYLKSVDPKHPYLDRIKDMHENRFSTIGKYMYVLNHGADAPDNISIGLMPALERIIVEEEIKTASRAKRREGIESESTLDKKSTTAPVPIITIQDRLRERAREIAGEVEGWIDEFFIDIKTVHPKKVEDFVNLFKAEDLKAPHMRYVQGMFEKRALEISTAANGKDKELTEAYSNFTKSELKKFDLFHQNLLAACNMMQEVAKVERAPRMKKPISQEKLVDKIKYKKNDAALGIVSQHPVGILGAKEMWVYNTKTRKIAQYKALDERGLAVKGASLIQFSTDSQEKTVRKPAETLADFKKASKVKLRTFMKDLSTLDVPAQGKLNEHHLILRIDK